MRQILINSWYKKNFLTYFLMPFSCLFQIIIAIRQFLYLRKAKKLIRFPVPIIVVGNITVGGTGKTPLVIHLVEFLREEGYTPGIVSRGYGGHSRFYPLAVDAESDPYYTGDEALLLARRAQCPVVIDPNRVEAVNYLLSRADCDVIISDDGLQHYALHRDIEIIVIDGERRFGNGWCLPAGPLREPIKRLQQADFIVVNGKTKTKRKNEYQMALQSDLLHSVRDNYLTKNIDKLKNKIVHAVAGIGNPQRFFNLLRKQGLTIIEHVFNDHYFFQPHDFNFSEEEVVVMTEKDAVKCDTWAKKNFWYLPVYVHINEKFHDDLLRKLQKKYLSNNE